VVGGRNEQQFKDSIAAVSLTLTEDESRRLDAVSRPPLIYPYWHQRWTARSRLGPADLVAGREAD
jgi:hypothetical protein